LGARELFAGIVSLDLIGFTSSALLAFFEKRLMQWQHP
jgi:ABC-type nitrate/sulfonate/bicarbonate transport system permease component